MFDKLGLSNTGSKFPMNAQKTPMRPGYVGAITVACEARDGSSEAHRVWLKANGQLDLSEHWAAMGGTYRQLVTPGELAMIALEHHGGVAPREHPRCLALLENWRRNRGAISIDSWMPVDQSVQEYIRGIERMRPRFSSTNTAAIPHKEMLRRSASRYLHDLVWSSLHTRIESSYCLGVPTFGDQFDLNEGTMDFHTWWTRVRPWGHRVIITPTGQLTVDAEPVERWQGLDVLMLQQVSVIFTRAWNQKRGFGDLKAVYALVDASKDVLGIAAHPRLLKNFDLLHMLWHPEHDAKNK